MTSMADLEASEARFADFACSFIHEGVAGGGVLSDQRATQILTPLSGRQRCTHRLTWPLVVGAFKCIVR